MTRQDFPRAIEVFEIGARRLYVKTGPRSFALSEDDLTPEELVGIANDIASRQAKRGRVTVQQEPAEAATSP